MYETMPQLNAEKKPPSEQTVTHNIFQRIQGIMEELTRISKGKIKVNGQYTFVSHDAVAAAIHPLLVKHGIVVVPTVEEMRQDQNRTVVKLAVSFINVDSPQDNFICRYWGYGIDNGDKGPGKAISYAFKYAILKTFCLETGDDPDNDAKASYEPAKCLEFDSILPVDLTDKDRQRLNKFLAYSSHALQIHVEDVKREAVARPADFLREFKEWKPGFK